HTRFSRDWSSDVCSSDLSAVFTQNIDRGLQFAHRVEAGMTFINEMTVQDEAHVAFGGGRNSGLGRFNGEWAIEEFTTDHTIGVRSEERRVGKGRKPGWEA